MSIYIDKWMLKCSCHSAKLSSRESLKPPFGCRQCHNQFRHSALTRASKQADYKISKPRTHSTENLTSAESRP
jgi:hypothetical protein